MPQGLQAGYSSNSILVALNFHLKTDSRRTIQEKQKTIIINLRHKQGQRHGENREKQKLLWIYLYKEIGFELLSSARLVLS